MTDERSENPPEAERESAHISLRPAMYVLWGIAVVLAVTDFFHHRHTTFKFEGFPAFYGLYAFLACSILAVGGKALRAIVKRREDYYDR